MKSGNKANPLAKVEVIALVLGVLWLGLGMLHQVFPPSHAAQAMAVALRWLGIACFAYVAFCRKSITPWIFVAMLAGVEFGFDAPHAAMQTKVLSDIFLRLVKAIVAPLILSTLIVGIAGHGDLKSVGRMGIKSIVLFEVITTLALFIGLFAINITKAGVGLAMSTAANIGSKPLAAPAPAHFDDFLLHVFPENIAKSISEGQILQVVVFAIIFAIALASLSEAKRAPVLRLCESISEVMFRFTNIVMYLAPLAVFAALAVTVGSTGLGVLASLGKLVGTLYGSIAVFVLIVLWPTAKIFRVPIAGFLSAVSEPASIAFATATSEAALPAAMEQMEAFGVPRRIVAFVIPTGYSFNLLGTTLYAAIASVFIAQAAGIHLSLGTQLAMMGTLMLTSKGVAGVPRATLVVLFATAATFGLPEAPIAIILGVDAVMDMARTMLNVVGNCLASVCVAQWEGEFEAEKPSEAVLAGVAE